MDTAETVWKLDQVINEFRQAIAKLELAKGEITAGHYQAMADEAAAQHAPRTEPAEASEVKVGESIIIDGRVRKVVGAEDDGPWVLLLLEGNGPTRFVPNALLDVVVDTKLADEAATKAALKRCWSVLRKPDTFDDAQAAHLAAGLAQLGTEPRR